MSQEHVAMVRGIFDAWNRGDRDGWLSSTHPEVEWSSAILRQVEGRETVTRGRTELRRFWDDWHAVWDLQLEVTEVHDLGDTLVALASMRTKGKSSGAETERSVGYVIQLEDGLVRRVRAYLSEREALEAAGLRG